MECHASPKRPSPVQREGREHGGHRRDKLRRQIGRAPALDEKAHQNIGDAKADKGDQREAPGRLPMRPAARENMAAVEDIGDDAADEIAAERRRDGAPGGAFDQPNENGVMRRRRDGADRGVGRKLARRRHA